MHEPRQAARPSARAARLDTRIAAAALASALPLLALAACSGRRQTSANHNGRPVAASPANSTAAGQAAGQSTAPAAEATPAPAPPQDSEVKNKLASVFRGAVEADPARGVAPFVGDFNGDGSEDIAVAVRPTARGLAEINSEVSNWIVGDPRKVVLPDPHKAVQKLPAEEPVTVGADDALLAVIHGHEAAGWRNREAQQAYLIKNALGRAPRVQPQRDALKEFRAATAHRLYGDVIRQDLDRADGFLYWTGAKYAWLPASKPAAK